MTIQQGLPVRTCKLPECQQEFTPNTSWQAFCGVACRNKYMAIERKRGVQMLRESKVRL